MYPLDFEEFLWVMNRTILCAELDFVVQIGGRVIPLEVKKGKHTKSTSFNIFLKWYKCPYGIRVSGKNFGFENNIRSVPLYAAWCIHPD